MSALLVPCRKCLFGNAFAVHCECIPSAFAVAYNALCMHFDRCMDDASLKTHSECIFGAFRGATNAFLVHFVAFRGTENAFQGIRFRLLSRGLEMHWVEWLEMPWRKRLVTH